TFRLHGCRSLKGKRKIVKSMIARIRNNFNASVAEVDHNDSLRRADLGVAAVGNDRRVVNAKLDKMINLAEAMGLAELIDSELEIITL
ncbi:MAG: DUF503 domain-containing protein, partial [Desulfobacterales bacterium]|nr:DUF503 domain-containing protein [Desulfobacterales bacterium]